MSLPNIALIEIAADEYDEMKANHAEHMELLAIAFRAIRSEDPRESYNELYNFVLKHYPVYTQAELMKEGTT